jgi:membrane protein
VIYKMLPESPPAWKDVWVGAVVTAALFDLGKHAVGLYLSKTGVASSFGAAGSLIALLLWVYYSAQIFFLGGSPGSMPVFREFQVRGCHGRRDNEKAG